MQQRMLREELDKFLFNNRMNLPEFAMHCTVVAETAITANSIKHQGAVFSPWATAVIKRTMKKVGKKEVE